MVTSDLERQVRRLQIRAKRAVSSLLGGQYHSAFHGTGLAFEDVREYQPGDDVRGIDWNVTARMGLPFVKRFVEERELTVLLAVDVSASVLGAKRTVAAELAALVAFAALYNGDRVGLLAFTDRVEAHVPPAKGTRHALRMVRDILGFRPRRPGTDLAAALDHLARTHKRRAIVFLISDFVETPPPEGEGRPERSNGWWWKWRKSPLPGATSDRPDPPPSGGRVLGGGRPHPYRKPIEIHPPPVGGRVARSEATGGERGLLPIADRFRRVARTHELVAVRIVGGLEASFPNAGLVDLEDAETGERLLVDSGDPGFRAGVERLAAERAAAFRSLARSAGADALDVTTAGDHAEELVRFFRLREKKK